MLEFTGVAIRTGKNINDVIIGYLYDDKEAEKDAPAELFCFFILTF